MVDAAFETVRAFHQAFFPTYGPTPLKNVPGLASELGCKAVYIKDESDRFGLPAFKILGVSWALCATLSQKYNVTVGDIVSLQEEIARDPSPVRVFTATDGNHGRALAHVATRLGLKSTIYVPHTVPDGARSLIIDEGADLVALETDYDGAVRVAERESKKSHGGLLIQDSSWPGYETIPMEIVRGYTTLFNEIDEQLAGVRPTHVVVPVGVGSLAHSAVLWYHPEVNKRSNPPTVVTVEPVVAPCLRKSLAAGHPVSVTTRMTIMDGLNCGTVSALAWPDLQRTIDPENAIVVSDDESREAVSSLHQHDVHSGPCGAAALAAARKLHLPRDATVILLSTEGSSSRQW